jgi:adhesin HecA-like repeat protein
MERFMPAKISYRVRCALVLACVNASPWDALADHRTAVRTAGGNWTTAAWSFNPGFPPPPPTPPNYPDNFGTNTFDADVGTFAVTMNHPPGNVVTVNSLSLGFGGSLTWDGSAGAQLNIDGGPINNGGIMSLNAGDFLGTGGNVNLSGQGFISLNAPDSTILSFGGNNQRLTLTQHTVRGQGRIGFSTQVQNITNDGGFVVADSGTLTISVFNDLTQINGGTLLAQNGGVLQLNGAFVNNTDGTIEITSGAVELKSGADITGGTLKGSASGQFRILDSTANRFNSVTLVTGTKVNLDSGADLALAGTIANNGTFTLAPGPGTQINIEGAVELSGTGRFVLQGQNEHQIRFSTPTSSLILGAGQSIFGEGDVATGFGGVGTNTLTNHGQIVADVDGRELRVFAGNVVNTGTMESGDGARLTITNFGTFNNAGGTIRANAGSDVLLNGTDVRGGTIASSGDGIVFVTSATFRNLTNAADLVDQAGASLFLDGTINNTGTITLLSGSDLLLIGNTTLSGGGTVTMGPNAQVSRSGAGSFTLTNLNNTFEGEGSFANASISVDNRGLIDANVNGATMLVRSDPTGSFINKGTMQASNGGILNLGIGTIQNDSTGIIRALDGSIVEMGGGAFLLNQQATAFIRAEENATVTLSNGAEIKGGRTSTKLSTSGSGFDETSTIRLNGLDVRLEDLINDGLVVTSTGGGTLKNVINRGQVRINPPGRLTLEGTLTLDSSGGAGGLIVDGGSNPPTNAALLIKDQVTITSPAGNAGVLTLKGVGGAGQRTAFIQGNGPNPQLTNESFIVGGGIIGTGSMRLINKNTIIANDPTTPLDLTPASATGGTDLDNQGGFLIAASGGTMVIVGDVTNTGTISAEFDSDIVLRNVDVNNAGGAIQATEGIVHLNDPGVITGTTIIRGGTLGGAGQTGKISNPKTATLEGAGTSGIAMQGNLVGENNSNTTMTGTFTFSSGGNTKLMAGANNTTLTIAGSTRFSGIGTTCLTSGGAGQSVITGLLSSVPTLDITANHVIEGTGRIGGNGLTVTNSGIIASKNKGGTTLDLSGVSITNGGGTLKSETGTTLRLENTLVDNSNGLIRAEDASSVQFRNGTVIERGIFARGGTGRIVVPSGHAATLVQPATSSTALIEVQDDAALTLKQPSGRRRLPAVFLNGATVTLNADLSSSTLRIEGEVALEGLGHIIMSDSPGNFISGVGAGAGLINRNNIIRGAGVIGSGMAFANADPNAVVIADGVNPLTLISPGDNRGQMEARGSGGMIINAPNGFANRKFFKVASGSKLRVFGAMQNLDFFEVDGDATMTFFTNSGDLFGKGTINGEVVNQARLKPGGSDTSGSSVGSMNINGNLTQQGTDPLLTIQFDEVPLRGGPNVVNDLLNVSGALALAGELEVSFLGGKPLLLPGDQATVLTFASRSGDVTIVNNTGFDGLTFTKVYDATSLTLQAGATFPGDADLNGRVDVGDLGTLATNWQMSANWLGGDFDGTGFVDVNDLALLATHWQAGTGGVVGSPSFNSAQMSVGIAPSTVPEPHAVVGIAFIATLLRRRRL